MQAAVVINAAAGALGGRPARVGRDQIERAFSEAGLSARFTYAPPDSVAAAIDRALLARPEVLVAGGGDGTISSAAGRLAGLPSTRLGILPLGTLNHFSRDLGIGEDVRAAVRAIAGGRVQPVDVAEVNGRKFINNCSIGAYPEAVRRRERLRQQHGHGKHLAMVLASLEVIRRLRRLRAELDCDGDTCRRRTPFVLVSNNRYDTQLVKDDRRDRLDAGQLWIYTTGARGRWDLLRLAARALVGRLEQADDFECWPARELRLSLPERDTLVGIDGEVVRLNLPLRIRILPRALSVCVPDAP